jgi:hypothetical protein
MKKQLFIMISIITMHAHTMEMQNKDSFPHEIVTSIIHHSLPQLNLYYQNVHKPGKWYYTEKGIFPDDSAQKDQENGKKATHNLKEIMNQLTILRLINKSYNDLIVKNIITLLKINTNNINPFLIRSTQANIPYFIKLALAHEANPNFVHKSDGYTSLLCATKNNHYGACKYLLKHGASVHMKRDNCYAAYVRDPYEEWPISIAIKNNNLELVNLFITYKAHLDFCLFNTSPLFYAAENNNPYILATILETRTQAFYHNHWSENEIEQTLEKVKSFPAKTDKEKLENRACVDILQKAQEQLIKI